MSTWCVKITFCFVKRVVHLNHENTQMM